MRLTRDFLSGLMFATLSVATMAIAASYDLGTPAQMGPGFFPMLVGALLAILGAVIAIQAFSQLDTGDTFGSWHIRPLTVILAAICCFGLLVERGGLIAALVALVALSRLASRGNSLLETATLVVVISAGTIAIFVYGLQVPLKLVP